MTGKVHVVAMHPPYLFRSARQDILFRFAGYVCFLLLVGWLVRLVHRLC